VGETPGTAGPVNSRLGRVAIVTTRGVYVIDWVARDVLVARLRTLEDSDRMVRAFEAAGASHPVKLPEPEGPELVLEAIEGWGRDLGTVTALDARLVHLREALYGHLLDRDLRD
jgi:hypothetical protein